jgi:F0F1-type ATP synthase assembly protein I
MSNRTQDGMSSFYRGGLTIFVPVLIVVAVIFAVMGNWGATGLCAAFAVLGGLTIMLTRNKPRSD